MKNDEVKYMTLNEKGGAAMIFDEWFMAMDLIDYLLNKTETHSMVLFELVDGKIVNGMRYIEDGRQEVVI